MAKLRRKMRLGLVLIAVCAILQYSGEDMARFLDAIINSSAKGGCAAGWMEPLKKRVEENPVPTNLTKKIFISWQQGFDAAPQIVQGALRSWILNNPTWEVIQVTNENVNALLEGTDFDALFGAKLNSGNREARAAYSDIIRLFLIEKYGGVWADATVLCAIPLDAWLPFVVDSELDFFGFRMDSYSLEMTEEHPPLGSWFLYGTPKSPIIQKWKQEMISYWENRTTPHAYLWVHYNLFHVFKEDKDLANKWNNAAVLNRKEPIEWHNGKLVGRACSGFLGGATVLKVTYRGDESRYNSYVKAIEDNECGLCYNSTDCEKNSTEMFESLKTWCEA